jgi:thiosulfate dehydrogenase
MFRAQPPRALTTRASYAIVLTVSVALSAAISCRSGSDAPALTSSREPQAAPAPAPAPAPATPKYRPPIDAEIPQDEAGAAVRRGMALVNRTYELLPEHTGSGLHCTSCHLEGGTKAFAAPWLGLLAKFPEYRARSGKQDTIEDRINDCFTRSLNGKPLPNDSPDMAAIVSYMRFISRDVPAGETPGRGFARVQAPPTPDRARGEQLYQQRCLACHGADGQGLAPGGAYAFPPLAGPRSFNIGAGMARLNNAAAFIRANMPLGQGGTLTEQDAYDIASYFIQLDRPDFPARVHDWPKGGKPSDARY